MNLCGGKAFASVTSIQLYNTYTVRSKLFLVLTYSSKTVKTSYISSETNKLRNFFTKVSCNTHDIDINLSWRYAIRPYYVHKYLHRFVCQIFILNFRTPYP